MAQSHDARLTELAGELGSDEVRFPFRDLVEKALQELIDAELTEGIDAEPHERTESRTNRRNGSRPRAAESGIPASIGFGRRRPVCRVQSRGGGRPLGEHLGSEGNETWLIRKRSGKVRKDNARPSV